MENIIFRRIPNENDIQRIKEIVESTGFFYEYEVEVATDLLKEKLYEGIDYEFLFAEIDGITVGYTCYSTIECTISSYDLYWIVVDDKYRGKGIGKVLIEETCKHIKELGGTNVYAETSGTDHYIPTQKFYLSNGFEMEARIKDFYRKDDDKLIYTRHL